MSKHTRNCTIIDKHGFNMQKMQSNKREECVVTSGCSSHSNNTLRIKAIGGSWDEGGKILSRNHRLAIANRGFIRMHCNNGSYPLHNICENPIVTFYLYSCIRPCRKDHYRCIERDPWDIKFQQA